MIFNGIKRSLVAGALAATMFMPNITFAQEEETTILDSGNTTNATVDVKNIEKPFSPNQILIDRVYEKEKRGICNSSSTKSIVGALSCLEEDMRIFLDVDIINWNVYQSSHFYEILRKYPKFAEEFMTQEEAQKIYGNGEDLKESTKKFINDYLEETGQKTQANYEADKEREFWEELEKSRPIPPDEDEGTLAHVWFLFKNAAYQIRRELAIL